MSWCITFLEHSAHVILIAGVS